MVWSRSADRVTAVPIDDEAGQVVRFAEYKPARADIVHEAKRVAHRNGPAKSFTKESGVNDVRLGERPYAQADLRSGRKRGVRQEGAIRRHDTHRLAG